jgi:hypothetical protein
MFNPLEKIVKSYAFIYNTWCGGHIFEYDDGRATLVHSRKSEGGECTEIFSGDATGTAVRKAVTHVLENIDAEAKFYDDQDMLDLTKWIARN